ncbi:MAG: ABC transporter ATP-binding protein, partial [Candidatus Bipolaricaulis sp.]|nr:ABC transporter ATP-binding protein [Candidatus Bipolaricaulis sp.]
MMDPSAMTAVKLPARGDVGDRGPTSGALLEIRNLEVQFGTEDGIVRAVDGVTYTIEREKTLGVVGESG